MSILRPHQASPDSIKEQKKQAPQSYTLILSGIRATEPTPTSEIKETKEPELLSRDPENLVFEYLGGAFER